MRYLHVLGPFFRHAFGALLERHQSADVFPDDVELQIDHRAFDDGVEVRQVVGVGDDGHLEAVRAGVADGEADAVDADRSFLDGHVALASHLRVSGVAEGVIPAAVGLAHVGADGRLVDVALDDVAVQATVHQHTALHVHTVAHVEQSEVGALQCLAHGSDGVGVVRAADDGQGDGLQVGIIRGVR